MPISRVRRLTEYASTPYTPAAASTSANPPKTPNSRISIRGIQ
jgi:hypothetical protein